MATVVLQINQFARGKLLRHVLFQHYTHINSCTCYCKDGYKNILVTQIRTYSKLNAAMFV